MIKVDKFTTFNSVVKTDTGYDQEKYDSILDSNYNNFCLFCDELRKASVESSHIECEIDHEKKSITFLAKFDKDVKKYKYNHE